MNQDELLLYASAFYEKGLELLLRKNRDYAGGDDPFRNFESVNALNISVIDGFLTRMMDKMSRISQLSKSEDFSVKDESIEDTLIDLANYSVLLSAYLKSKKETQKHDNQRVKKDH